MSCQRILTTFIALFSFFGRSPQGALTEITVSQWPSSRTVVPGADVTVNCSFNLPDRITEAFIIWKKQNATLFTCKITGANQCSPVDAERRFNASVHRETRVSILQISDTTLEDNGTYYCHLYVEKPLPIKHAKGDGTTIIIIIQTPEGRPAEWDRKLPWKLSALLVPAILLCILCTMWQLAKGNRPTGVRSKSQEPGEVAEHCARPSLNKADGARGPGGPSVPVERLAPTHCLTEPATLETYSEIRHSTPECSQSLYTLIGSWAIP